MTPHGGKKKEDHYRQKMMTDRKNQTGERDVIKQELKLHP
jgi:hypothetical protein